MKYYPAKNYERTASTFVDDAQPSTNLFAETTKADSSLYNAYNLRPYNPDDIWQKRGNYDIFDEMRTDDQISALLTLKKFFILNGDRDIQCEDEKIKDFLEMNLDYFYDGFFEKALFNILSCIDYGYSLTEKIFAYEDVPEFGKKIILKKLKTRPPHSFEFDQDDKGNIINIRQDQSKGADIKIDPKKMIHYVYQMEFDNPYGKSELNMGVYRAWWSKNAIIKFWNIYLERFGMPTAVGKYPTGRIANLADFKKTLKNLQAKTSITMPTDFEVQLLQAASSGSDGYEKAIDKYNTMIARKMLIPDLFGMSGSETGGGSYALGKEQFNMFYNNIQHERENLERIINKEIIYPLVTWNFGSKAYAQFKFSQPDNERKEKDLRTWLDAVNTGKIPVTDQHINWFLKQVNAPEIDEKELEEINEQKEEMRESITGNKEEGNDEQEDKKDSEGMAEKDEKGNDEEKPERKEKQFAKLSRPITQYEKKVDFAKIDRATTQTEIKYIMQLAAVFKLAINGLIDDIRKRKIIEGRKLDQINKLQLRHENKVVKTVRDMLNEAYQVGAQTAETPRTYKLSPGVEILSNKEIAQLFDVYAYNTASTEYAYILSKVKPILAESIKSGMGVQETVKLMNQALTAYDVDYVIDNYEKIKGIAESHGYKDIDSFFQNLGRLTAEEFEAIEKYVIPLASETGAFRLETIARTTTSTAVNEARLSEFKDLIDVGEIAAFQYSAILDNRTTELCRDLDGKIFKTDEAQYYNPPNHYNCRSLLIPIFIEEKYEYSEMPATKREDGNFLKLNKE